MVIVAPMLDPADERDMKRRALAECCDLDCDEAVVRHLHRLGISIRSIDDDLAQMIAEARKARMEARHG